MSSPLVHSHRRVERINANWAFFAIWAVLIEKSSLAAAHQTTTLTVNVMSDIFPDEVELGELLAGSSDGSGDNGAKLTWRRLGAWSQKNESTNRK